MPASDLVRQISSDQDGGPGGSYLGKYYTTIKIGKYNRESPFKESKFNPTIIAYLPIPNELRDDTSVGYTNVNLETVGDFINGAGFQPLLGAALLRNSGTLISTAGNLAATALGSAAGAGTRSNAVENAVTGALTSIGSNLFPPEQITSAIQQDAALAPNPNPSVQFQGPVLRDFAYTWAFYPKSAAESENIQKLIKVLKRSALPRNSIHASAAILDYPDVCQVNFYPWDSNGTGKWGWNRDGNSIIRYKKCVMQGVNVNYNPFGTPAFFEGTKLPVSYQLTISFKEMEYMLSDDWNDTSLNSSIAPTANSGSISKDTALATVAGEVAGALGFTSIENALTAGSIANTAAVAGIQSLNTLLSIPVIGPAVATAVAVGAALTSGDAQ